MKIRSMVIPLLALAFGACRNGNTDNKTKDIVEIPVLKLEAQDTSLTNDYVADMQAVKNVEVRSRMHGFIDRVLVDEGQQVKQGQLLFQLNDREYVIALNRAKANLASALSAASIADVELERIKTLVDKKVISPSEMSLGEAKLSEAESRFDVSENEYLQFVRNGKGRFDHDKETTLILSDGSIYPVKGKIQTHENAFSDNTGSIAFRAMFNNPGHILKHGVSGKIRLNSRLTGSVLVPQKSVFEIQDKSYVFVLDKNNTVQMRSFVPKLSLSGYYVVGSGLKPGEVIVYEGVQELRDGKVIKPVYTTMKKLLASK
ncbi:MAG: efflux RND transporter periplasmic adaptor subunit [Pedobacter sp.]|nr:MAG: efflux RND transporter periplasmic adaptor subunit [Pedobacter sp.]